MATNTNETSDSVASEQNPLQTPNPQLGYDFSSLLPQENIDAIYFAEYGETTDEDRYDWILLFCGLRQDMMKIQEDMRIIADEGVDINSAASYFFGQFHEVMQKRVAAVGRGEPIVVNGHPDRIPGQMMKKWAADIAAGKPSLYHRLEAALAEEIKERQPSELHGFDPNMAKATASADTLEAEDTGLGESTSAIADAQE
ncbi:hypothetical protein PSV08DRAFT_398813 [Bipolaris maydis]|nr:hypothetical protein J3E73DRAFT_420688 [Bipolaris maydis]KAJ6274569.1 hypothetical protein PSV08DRAFT_398813 [Bipolaris maydis]KAJ6286149.1 hypothetical protein J3E71DRAFT_349912 [Bipolaris maydis]